MFSFLNGSLPRIPKTAIEVYSKMIDQNVCFWRFLHYSLGSFDSSDMNGQIAEKVDSTNETLEAFKEYTIRRLESFGEGPSVSHFKYFHVHQIKNNFPCHTGCFDGDQCKAWLRHSPNKWIENSIYITDQCSARILRASASKEAENVTFNGRSREDSVVVVNVKERLNHMRGSIITLTLGRWG